MANSLVFFNPATLLRTLPLYRSPSHSRIIRRNRHFIGRGMKLPSANGGEPSKEVARVRNFSNGPVPSGGGPTLPIPNIPIWAKWVLGSIVCLAVPFYKKILRIEDKVEKTAETVAEAVEKVAETAERVASDIADALPDNSKLKQEVINVEHLAEKVDKAAAKADEFIHKVDHITDEMQELVEPGENTENETLPKDKEETISSSNL